MLFILKYYPNDYATETSFLGLKVDSKLLWHYHGDHLEKMLNKKLFLLRNLSKHVSRDTLKTAYFGLVHSSLTYGLAVWGHASCRHRVFALQRRAIRIVANLGFREDCRNAFKDLKILTLPSLYILTCVNYIKSNLSYFSLHADIHGHNTRNRDKLCQQNIRLRRTQTASRFFGVKFYNILPTDIKSLPQKLFINKVKQHLFNGAFYDTDEYLQYFLQLQ